MILGGEPVSWLRRIDPGREQRFVRIDVADTGQMPLVHDDLLDRLAASSKGLPKLLGRKIVSQRLGSNGGSVLGPLFGPEQQQGSQPAHIPIDQLFSSIQPG